MLNTTFKNHVLALFLCLLSSFGLKAQLSVTSGILTPQQLVEDVLIGNGVRVSNVTLGTQTLGSQIGTFSNMNSNLPMSEGIIMATGYALNAATSGNNSTSGYTSTAPGCQTQNGLCSTGDTTLSAISGQVTKDAAVIEFDFVPLADTIRFKYSFASEEYSEYNCSNFNDVFAFMLSGPGIPTPVNLAVIPNTTIPVAVNSVNNGVVGSSGGIASNCQQPLGSLNYSNYYIDNWGGPHVQYDGFTVTFEAKYVVTPCTTYHIKLAIADVLDGALDSGVFLEKYSFYSDAVDVTVETPRNDNTLVENCNPAVVSFTKQVPVAQNFPINYNLYGTAIQGTDYTLSSNNVTIAAGTDSFALVITPVNDGLAEGIEDLFLAVEISNCKWDTLPLYVREEIILPAPQGFCAGSNARSIHYGWSNVPQATAYTVSYDNGITWDTLSGNTASIYGLQPSTTRNLLVRAVGGYNVCNFNIIDTITCSTLPCNLTAAVDSIWDTSCFGVADGQVFISVSSGNPPYSYVLNDNVTFNSGVISGLASGANKVTVWDQDSCSVDLLFNVGEPFPINIYVNNKTPTLCSYSNEGTTQLSATNGIGGYTFSINGVNNSSGFFDNLYGGTHEIIVTDGNGCESRDSVTIFSPPPISTTLNYTSPSCYGLTDGNASVIATGGTSSSGLYSYFWSPSGQTSSQALNIGGGYQAVVVTDDNGCVFNDSVFVTQPDSFTFTIANMTQTLCHGYSDGSATINVTGGVGGFSYAWSGSTSTTNMIDSVAAGTYTLTVTDLNNCSGVTQVTVTEPIPLQFTNTATTPVTCNGGSDGTAWVSVDFANPTYQWIPSGHTTAVATGLSAGQHTVIASDFKGCQISTTIIVEQPTPIITIFTEDQAASCFEATDGIMSISASGGTPWHNSVYTYEWSTFPTQYGATAVGLKGGQTYMVTVTDSLGCQTISNVTVSHPDQIVLSYNIQEVSCAFGNDGQVIVTPTGGTAPFTYVWNSAAVGQTTDTAINLMAGNYHITATDANGCTKFDQLHVGQPLPLQSLMTGTNVLCKGDSTGIVTVQTSGGVSPYTYEWNNSTSTNTTLHNLPVGTYVVTTTDANGCIILDSLTLTEPDDSLKMLLNTKDAICHGGRDGELILEVTGGKQPYQYRLNDELFTTTNHFAGLFADDYNVTVRDANGCLVIESTTVREPLEMTVFAGNGYEIELGDSVTLLASTLNAIPPISYSWTPPATLSCTDCQATVAKPTFDEFYRVKITDARRCIADDFVTVRVIKPRDIYVATAFSPNNDGINDYLFVQAHNKDNLKVLLFRIYDRWGELVYETTDVLPNNPESGWNGELKGQKMNSSVYSWFAEIEFQDGERRVFKGNSTMVR